MQNSSANAEARTHRLGAGLGKYACGYCRQRLEKALDRRLLKDTASVQKLGTQSSSSSFIRDYAQGEPAQSAGQSPDPVQATSTATPPERVRHLSPDGASIPSRFCKSFATSEREGENAQQVCAIQVLPKSLVLFWFMQKVQLSSFRLDVNLLEADRYDTTQTISLADEVGAIAAELQSTQGISTSIKLQSSYGATTAPPPAALQSLAPFLSGVNMYTVSQSLVTYSTFPYAASCSAFTAADMATLRQSSTDLQSLCVSDQMSSTEPTTDPIGHGLVEVAQLSRLTLLHLTLTAIHQPIDFQPLSQLSFVEDLALSVPQADATSCPGVLASSSETLRSVSLAAQSWSLDTYSALQHIQQLQMLMLREWVFGPAQATRLAGITAGKFHMDLHHVRELPANTLLALSIASPMVRLHELTLWGADDDSCQQLQALPFLHTLTIIHSPTLTGATLNVHPNVTKLRLISCPRISATGLQHMLSTALPRLLTHLSILWASNEDRSLQLWMGRGLLHSLVHGSNLVYVDLRGASGLSRLGLFRLKAAIRHEQDQGKLEPAVKFYLSDQFLVAQHMVVQTVELLHVPPLYAYPSPRGPETLVCKHRRHTWYMIAAAAQLTCVCSLICSTRLQKLHSDLVVAMFWPMTAAIGFGALRQTQIL